MTDNPTSRPSPSDADADALADALLDGERPADQPQTDQPDVEPFAGDDDILAGHLEPPEQQ